jgi:hypothetical protein
MRPPPDKYTTIKISLKKILKDDENSSNKIKLFNVITKANKLVIHVYQFLRLWILKKYHNKKDIPNLNTDVIKMAFKALIKASSGPKPKGINLDIYSEFVQFYEDVYSKLNYEKQDGLHLSQIINYLAVDILTNIENNIKLNFINYLKRYVNAIFKNKHEEILKKLTGKLKLEKKKELRKELYNLKQDLINGTKNSDKKYHIWLDKYRYKLLPENYKNSYIFDVSSNPQSYIKYMIYMNIKLQQTETKMYQFFPLRTNIYPKFCPIDTKSLIEIMVDSNKKELLDNLETNKNLIWNKFFKLENPIFKSNNYNFDYRISTDCFSVSLQFINKKYAEKEAFGKKQKTEGRKRAQEEYKDLSRNEIDNLKKMKTEEKKGKEKQIRLKIKERKDAFKKLPKEEKAKIIDKILKDKIIDFPYLDELNETQLDDLKKSNKVYVDPGKRTLLCMMDDNGTIFNYTNRTRMYETKRLKYQRLLKNYKDRKGISKIENKLSDFNSKTCNLNEFKKYVKNKNKINSQLDEAYKEEIFRKYKWYAYINTKKSEAKLLDKIENIYGKDCKLCYGDWSISKQMRNFISTPNIGLKRILKERFFICNLDEFRTSLLNYKTEEKCENLYLPDKNKKLRKIHAVLTYKMENNRYGCINRDINSVKNMKKIVKDWLINKSRPLRYRRGYDLTETTKRDTNPQKRPASSCQVVSSPIIDKKPKRKYVRKS